MTAEMIPWIYDGISLLLILLIVWRSAHRGFLRTVCLLFGGIIAVIGASWAADWLDGLVFTTFFEKPLSESVQRSLEASGGSVEQVVSSFPGFLSSLTESFFGSREELLFQVEQASMSAAQGIVDAAIRPAVEMLIGVVLFLIFFGILTFLLYLVSRALKILDHLPVIAQLNHLLGGIVGILQAVIVLLIVVALLHLIILMTGNSLSWLNIDLIEKTKILHIFYAFHPFLNTAAGVS